MRGERNNGEVDGREFKDGEMGKYQRSASLIFLKPPQFLV